MRRRGFTLLEVIIALGILVTSIVILMGTQTTAIEMTMEADRILVATQLAQEKIAEVRMLVEREGFPSDDLYEDGDFSDFGDEVLNLEFEDLDAYHYEFLVTEVDLEAASDLNALSTNLMSNLGLSGPPGSASATPPPDFSSLGISPEMITDALDPFLREVRVRVWWGESSEEAEEYGDEVILTTHVTSPNAQVFGQGGGTTQSGAPTGGANPNAGGGGRGNTPGRGTGGNGSTRNPNANPGRGQSAGGVGGGRGR